VRTSWKNVTSIASQNWQADHNIQFGP